MRKICLFFLFNVFYFTIFSQGQNIPEPPIVDQEQRYCEYDDEFVLYAEGENIKWYETDDGATILGYGNSYKPKITVPGIYRFYVSQTVNGIESNRILTDLYVLGTGVPTVRSKITPAEVCVGEENPTFVAQNVVGTVGWYEEDPGELGVPASEQISDAKSFVPNGKEPGDYTIWVVMYANGCYGPKVPATYTIIPNPPIIREGYEIKLCEYDEALVLHAEGGNIKWYKTEEGNTVLAYGNTFQVPHQLGIYVYYVSQTVNGIESKKEKVTVNITGTGVPTIRSLTSPAEVYEGEENPTFYASHVIGTVGWYESDPGDLGVPVSVQAGGETRFVPNGKDVGEYTIWAVMYANGCYGPKVLATYTIKPLPSVPVITVQNQGEEQGNLKIYSLGKQIIVEKTEPFTIRVTDIKGNIIFYCDECLGQKTIPIYTSGVYYVIVDERVIPVIIK